MTATTGDSGTMRWEPPGPGTWTLDKNHIPRPATAHMQGTFPAFEAGFAESSRRYGWLVRSFTMAAVNGFLYTNVVVAPAHEFEERFAACDRAFATKLWRDDLRRWETEVKPASLARHRQLLSVEPAELDDAALIAYLQDCGDHHRAMWTQHHWFNGCQMIPVGDFLVATTAWAGVPASEVAALLRGASPISRGWCPETERVVLAMKDDAAALAALGSDDNPAAILERLRSRGGLVADALAEWVLVTGHRPIDGFDVSNPTGVERPSFLVQCLRAAVREDSFEVAPGAVDAVRGLVPPEHRADFDERYEEARLVYHLRDERGIYSDAMAAGIMRRAMLAVGERLCRGGRLSRAEHAIDATVPELVALLDRRDPTPVDVLAARARHRLSTSIADAPEFLGDPPAGRPSFDGLPPAAARMMTALMGVNVQTPPRSAETAEAGTRELVGVGASGGRRRGVARVGFSPEDFDRITEGDILVTSTTGEAFNVVIAMVSALVTDQGNLMCHAAITAREYGIPAVVGTSDATATIPDGATIEVDGDTGVVRWS